MQKVLRSLICEQFPFDARVELELLSKRLDISNKQKQEELFKILGNYGINAVALGPGTNRYAFKLNGFVIKFATSKEGKIDNLKEFKMGPRLYPDVIQIHEVSENGTMLVTEYIQAFVTFSEMLEHEKEIKGILEKLSAVYMIGDVGVVAKNYSNWGLRVGTNKAVCLDFAYVYDVSSELFICQDANCHANAMMVQTADFSKLRCPACGAETLFETIRARIGNDLHKHEIGDLSNEGYVLTQSNILTQLDEMRSGYLKKKETKKETPVEIPKEILIDDFVMP